MLKQRRSILNRLFFTSGSRVDERGNILGVLNNLILHLHPPLVQSSALRFTYTWGLGGISAVLALMLGATGLLLMFRYDARVEYAYISIQAVETRVMFGSLVRSIHHWSANLLVITTFLHLVRVFLTGGYKQGRTANWLIGIALLVLVLTSNFTGYLLPWDQLAYWAITVSTSLFSYIPAIGSEVGRFLMAGPEVGQGALSNFYALHVVVLPVVLAGMMGYHFWKIRKNGGLSQPLEKGEAAKRVTTIPNLVNVEFAAAFVTIAVVTIYAMLRPAPLGQIANPLDSPNPAKAAWYFLGLQELLLHMHPLAAILLVAIVMTVLIIVPFIEKRKEDIGVYFRSARGKRAALIGFVLGFDLVPLLVIADEYWVDLVELFPNWPVLISTGLVPLMTTLLLLMLIYMIVRLGIASKGQRANHSEALVGVFSFSITSLIVLTIIGVFFRGENMALVLPFLN